MKKTKIVSISISNGLIYGLGEDSKVYRYLKGKWELIENIKVDMQSIAYQINMEGL